MVTVSHVVKNILDKHVFLQEAINQGIVSYNKLADNIKPEIESELGKKVKHNAIVMALRRYNENLEKKQHRPQLNYFREILLKTDICYIIVEESMASLDIFQNFYKNINFKHGGFYNIVHGNYEIGMITNKRYKDTLLKELSDEKIANVVDDLVVISLTHSEDFLFTPGVIYNVLRFVAWENINILSIILTPEELSLVVTRVDAMKCYNTLEKMINAPKNHK